jgi:curved DNA-binding protein CbpA
LRVDVPLMSPGRQRGYIHAPARGAEDPFAVLGLAARGDLTDEDVRAAWRRIAAATHPDREDGGDPDTFGAAAAAYDALRTSFGRGEALADLGLYGHAGHAGQPGHPGQPGRRRSRRGTHRFHAGASARYFGNVGHVAIGWRLALRVAGATAVVAVAVAVAGWTPATIALLVGAATWLIAARTR